MFLKKQWIFWLIATIIMMAVMRHVGSPLKSSTCYKSILSLEFASDKKTVQNVIHEWNTIKSANGKTLKEHALSGIWWDFLFILVYTGFFYNLFSSRILNNPIHHYASRLSLIAGVLDIIENLFMLLSLNGQISSIISFVTATAAFFKFVILAFLFVYFLLSVFLEAKR